MADRRKQHTVIVQKNGMATIGVLLGSIGFILSWIPLAGIWFGWILGVLSIVFSSVGLSRANQINLGRSAAIAGLILGILTLVFKSIPVVNLL